MSSVQEVPRGTEGSEVPLAFNPFLPEVREDPYPLYRRLRTEDPVHQSFDGLWILTRHADCVAVLRDHHRFSSDSRSSDLYRIFKASLGDEPAGFLGDDFPRSMLFIDPPDHTRLRTLVNKAFTARVVQGLRPHMQEIVDGLIDGMLATGDDVVDVVADLAYPLPIAVICEMLGVPLEDRHLFRGWSQELVLILDPMVTLEVLARAETAFQGFRIYFHELLADRRAHPRDDMLTALLSAEEEGQKLTEAELMSTLVLLLVAGHETTVNLIGNGTLALLRYGDQLERLRQDPSLIRTAVEELLRYDSPVQLTGRTVVEDLQIGGRAIRRGQQVVAVVGAANRDPAAFPDPDRLDVGREDNRHMSFGSGIHFCLGAPLARMEGGLAFEAMLRRMPVLELAGQPERRETITLRGLRSLPLRIR